MFGYFLKILSVLIFTFYVASFCSFSQSKDSLRDSLNYYLNVERDFQKSLNWAIEYDIQVAIDAGTNHKDYAESQYLLGEIYYNLGALDSGRVYIRNSYNLYQKLNIGDDINYSGCLNILAYSYHKDGNFEEAEKFYYQALDMKNRLFKEPNLSIYLNLRNLADFYLDFARYEDCEKYSLKAVEVARQIFQNDSPDLAWAIAKLGSFYQDMGIFDKAEVYDVESVEIFRRAYKDGHYDLARALDNLARLYSQKENWLLADTLFNEAYMMMKRSTSGDDPGLSILISNMAVNNDWMRKFDLAEKQYIESLEMLRRLYPGNNYDVAIGLNNMGLFYLESFFNSVKAEYYLNEAIKMFKACSSSEDLNLANSIYTNAVFYMTIGKYHKAELLFEEATTMYRNIYKGDNPKLANFIGNIGVFYLRSGKFDLAEPYLFESYEMSKRIYGNDHYIIAKVLSSIGGLMLSTGRYKEAEKYFTEALDILKINNPEENENLALSLHNLAGCYAAQGRNNESIPLFLKAYDIRKKILPSDHPMLAKSLSILSSLAENDIEKEKYLKESINIFQNRFPDGHPELAQELNNLGMLYFRRNNLRMADSMLNKAKDMNFALTNRNNKNILSNLADLYLKMDKVDKADSLYNEMISLTLEQYFNLFPSMNEKQKIEFWDHLKKNVNKYFSFCSNIHLNKKDVSEDMINLSIKTKSMIFKSTIKIRDAILNSNNNKLKEKYQEWISTKEFLVQLFSKTKAELSQRHFDIDSIQNYASKLEREISKESSAFNKSIEKQQILWSDIKNKLDKDEAAVDIIRFTNNENKDVYYALIITQNTNSHPTIVQLGEGEKLDYEFFEDYRANLGSKTKDYLSFERFWSRIYEYTKYYKHIYYSPDGIYHKINPLCLQLSNSKYLFDIQDIEIVNNLTDVIDIKIIKKDYVVFNDNAALFGNPDFKLSNKNKNDEGKTKKILLTENINETLRGLNFGDLPGTEKEVKEIEKILKEKKWKVNTYISEFASKDSIKNLNSPRVLHLATHGYFLPDEESASKELLGFERNSISENPMLKAGVLLAGASAYLNNQSSDENSENGLLTAYEAMNLNLDNTELVVLSACETGLGDIKNGDGVFGLRRAFHQAGAKSVIMSLWGVPDKQTSELMINFYKYWISGMTKKSAFKKAQKIIKDKYKNPFYWGAFVIVGD